MSMNMKQLRYVTILSQYNNFTHAAKELGISQPSLSQYIKKIEKQVGAELFIRVGQNVRLTEAGKTYLRIGNQILELENEMSNRLKDIADDRYGEITVGIAPYRCVSLMPAVIEEFHRYYPGIKIVLSEQVTSELKESAERGKLDLCISTLPIDEDKFEYCSIMKEGTVLAVPKALCAEADKVKNNYSKVGFNQYKKLPFISLPVSQIMGQALNELCEKMDIDISVTVECQDLVAVHSMVVEGIGAALLPFSLVKQHENDRVNYFLIEEATENREIVAFYRKDRYLSKPMRKMLDILTNMYMKGSKE